MKKTYVFSITVLISLFLFNACSPKISTFNGYVMDKHCFGIKDPSKETEKCLKMKDCESSGYGIAIKQDDDKYKFYKFDNKGHNLMKGLLSETEKKEDILINVKGKQVGDVIKVSSISEK